MKAALVGAGIGPSMTPALHEAEGAAQALDYSYVRFDTDAEPWRAKTLAEILDHAERLGFAGLNITHPHKTLVCDLLDELVGPAGDLRTVNTVVFTRGKRIGHTTDYTGFRAAVRQANLGLQGREVVQFGAGGAGAATALALLDEGASVTLVDVDHSRAQTLSRQLQRVWPGSAVTAEALSSVCLSRCDGALNATPLGMAAHPGMAFDPVGLGASAWVADIVYLPLETALLRAARARGLHVLNGGGMALHQAIAAFELITGSTADANRMARHFANATGMP